jgi:predicted Zn finger-like uncharacterized protein
MILTCPQCATQYNVDAAKFPAAGRDVRCAKCAHVWHQDAPEPERAPEPVFVAPAPEPAPRRAAYVAPAAPEDEAREEDQSEGHRASPWPGRIGLGLGWLALVGAVLVIGFAAVGFRQQVARTWPRTASLYAALGMNVNALGIDLRDISHRQETEDGQPVLAIGGNLVNLSSRPVSVPPIEVTLTDEGHRLVLRKSFAAGVATLAPGQIARFHARLSSPPQAARHLELRLAAQ